jgi:hypothetical protein
VHRRHRAGRTARGGLRARRGVAVGPTITRIPKTAKVGAKATVKGFLLGGATNVAFNGTPATIVSNRDT